jgi:hypothetical protein
MDLSRQLNCSMRTNEKADMTEANSCFPQFCEKRQKWRLFLQRMETEAQTQKEEYVCSRSNKLVVIITLGWTTALKAPARPSGKGRLVARQSVGSAESMVMGSGELEYGEGGGSGTFGLNFWVVLVALKVRGKGPRSDGNFQCNCGKSAWEACCSALRLGSKTELAPGFRETKESVDRAVRSYDLHKTSDTRPSGNPYTSNWF